MPASSSMSRRMLVSCSARPRWCASRMPSFSAQAEHPHRQPPDRARHPVAIEIERREVGRADILRHIHLHAVDDGEEILALAGRSGAPRRRRPAAAPADGPDTARRYRRAMLQRGQPLAPRPVGIGDVVDLPAEAVDLEHRLALFARQDAHRRIERTAGRGGAVTWVGCRRVERHAPAAGLDTGRRPTARRAISPAMPPKL